MATKSGEFVLLVSRIEVKFSFFRKNVKFFPVMTSFVDPHPSKQKSSQKLLKQRVFGFTKSINLN